MTSTRKEVEGDGVLEIYRGFVDALYIIQISSFFNWNVDFNWNICVMYISIKMCVLFMF